MQHDNTEDSHGEYLICLYSFELSPTVFLELSNDLGYGRIRFLENCTEALTGDLLLYALVLAFRPTEALRICPISG